MFSSKSRLLSKQKIRLFELLEENYHILSSKNYRCRQKTAIWERMKNVLNELGTPKTTDQWRRAWTDIRKTLRKKVYLRHTYEMKGAEVPYEFIYNESDLWVIRICGMDSLERPLKIEKDEETGSKLAGGRPTRSSKRVSNRKIPKKEPKVVKAVDEEANLISPDVVCSDDEATECPKSQINQKSPPKKNPETNSSNVFVSPEKVPVPTEDKNQLKQLVFLQRKQLAVTRQIYERQKCHNADERQSNARITNLLEEILLQLKRNQT